MLRLAIPMMTCLLWVSLAFSQSVGEPVEVAPKCEGTRSQVWASAAWSSQAKCWLVAWREGYLNEDSTDIWCARISAEGKPLDPAGIRLTKKAPGLRDMPRVASDGRNWLVVWEDMRNDRDWDVYGAVISADGKVREENGFRIAGGPRNQCRPDVGFAAGYYLVVWQELVGEGEPNTKGTAYAVRGVRLQPEGEPLVGVPIEIARVEQESHAFGPAVACYKEQVLTAFFIASFGSGNDYLARRPVDVATGRALGPAPEPSRTSNKHPIQLPSSEALRSAVLARNADFAFTVLAGHGLHLWKMAGDGTKPEYVAHLAKSAAQKVADLRYPVRTSLAASDKELLLVTEWPRLQPASRRVRMEIRGWRLASDGRPLDDTEAGFVVAAYERRDQLLPAVAAGPDGTFLVVYSERRGVDDMKVVARIIRPSP
ncbi:hypothetical protein HRbin36_00643 [bacterium HR36]|nr:hypothetical protein HRbin36_00643 [bacterium HR36]